MLHCRAISRMRERALCRRRSSRPAGVPEFTRLHQILRGRTTVVACPYETPGHRAGVLAALEDRNARRKRGFIPIDTLYEAPAASGHVVDKLRLVQPQAVKVD
jgi:hypothetical protein